MIRKLFISGLGALVLMVGGTVQAGPILYDWGFNVNGNTYCDLGPCDSDSANPALVPGIDISLFDFITGLGDITFTISGADSYYVSLFVDHDIDEESNTYFNEFGDTSGAPVAGQSWEIDEPGYVFGDIFDNFFFGALDNTNDVPGLFPDDVSMALAWDFSLAIDELATIAFSITEFAPESGFYLSHTDPDSDYSLFFSSTLDVTGGGGTPVPEPGTLWLLGAGLLALGLSRRRITKH